VIGAAGGTVIGPSGTSVVIPAGALAANTTISIAASSPGAPPLPTGFTASGQMFAFTPHGTTFAVPVTVTLPFDPALLPANGSPAFYKTNAQGQWEQIAGATFGTGSVSGEVTSFSDFVVIQGPPPPPPPPPPTVPSAKVGRDVLIEEIRGLQLRTTTLVNKVVEGGPMVEYVDFGPASFDAEIALIDGRTFLPDGRANGAINSSEDGTTFSLAAEAPMGAVYPPDDPLGDNVQLIQVQSFKKLSPTATLTFKLPQVLMETHDENAELNRVCPENIQLGESCLLTNSEIAVDLQILKTDFTNSEATGTIFYTVADQRSGSVSLRGFARHWNFFASSDSWSRSPFWSQGDFDLVIQDTNGASESHARLSLRETPRYELDLSRIETGDVFHVRVVVTATAWNFISGAPSELPTASGAYFRESLEPGGPPSGGGGSFEFTDLEPQDTPVPLPEADPISILLPPAPCVPGPGPNPAAGTLQFSVAEFVTREANYAPVVQITRSGGSSGAVTATFATSDGSAIAGADYKPLTTTVFFADGDTATRTVPVQTIPDTIDGEPDKTVNLTLTQPGGCASLGSQSTAVLKIQDEDLPPASFSVGGTVTGLVGTGLKLQDLHLVPITPGNGPFTFTLPTQSGSPYEVTILAQPSNPVQVCTVRNGSGTMGNSNVTNVEVDCATPPPPGGLDPGFGGGTGKVSSDFGGDDSAMLLQPDGKILMVGGSASDFMLARYNADGTLDGGFGNNGLVTTDIAGGADAAFGVALQSDGRIIVVGSARVSGNDDFAVVRYQANGSLDTSFGTQGKATTNFFGARDRAFALAVLADDSLVVVGDTLLGVGAGTDFALARYSADGELDTSFGGGDGKVNTDIAGGLDIAKNVQLESGGTLLVTGTITIGTSSLLGNTGLARYSTAGELDGSLDRDGKLSIDGRSLGEALAVQGDGRILIAGNVLEGGETIFGVMRLQASGEPDDSFGGRGLATAAFSTQDDYGRGIALDAQGRILVSGQASNLANPDFAVARFLPVGVLDSTFDTDGKFTVDFFGGADSAENIAVQAKGGIVLGGFAANGTQVHYGLARVIP